jgi:hypothetical protein
MESLMLEDEDLEMMDAWRLVKIETMRRQFNTPTTRAFVPACSFKTPLNNYFEGARFNIGMDVFKIVSTRNRGGKFSLVVRFEGVMDQ